jgi:GDPmannose 4,6-dehydratase
MWRMMQAAKPSDYVVATGQTHSVRDFLEEAFSQVGLDWREFVRDDPRQARPSDVESVCGDSSKIKRELEWTPTLSFKALVQRMVEHDLDLAQRERASGTTLRWL